MKTQSIGILQREAGKHPRLAATEETALAAAIKCGDQAALEKLVLSNLRLVLYIARQLAGAFGAIDDLASEGLIGLANAARDFDPTKGVRFCSFAFPVVRHRMLNVLRHQRGAFRVPRQIQQLGRRVSKTQEALHESLGRAPHDIEIADSLGVSERRIRRARITQTETLTLDAPLGDCETPLVETIGDEEAADAACSADTSDRVAQMHAHLDQLESRCRTILVQRYGLDGRDPKTLQEIAEGLNLTKERVRQLVEISIIQLRRAMVP
ncbi:hypothetical protein ASA1KI_31460 [Opitutales bacterium ASA1]|uniref:sigma-70 family RNA polymerase sigma factor n=1 Tax=Congregicoccus parvus TaxID=3081749 RepID=UPI002B2EA1C1|nr:hypothetical protein ASA1KI_31460 [Opitutales bacterium ASA1]